MEYTCIHLKTIIIAQNSPITFWKVANPSEKSMTLWKFYVLVNKGAYMDTIKKSYIYRETEMENQLNDKHTISPNKILETKLRRESYLTSSSFQPPPK